MNAPVAFRLPALPGWGMGLALAMLWLGRCETKAAQSSFGNVDAPVAGAPVARSWPAVDWGIEVAAPGAERQGWPVGQESIPDLRNEAGPAVLTLRSNEGDVVLNFGANQGLGLGPVVSVVAPTPGEGGENGTKSGQGAGPVRLGNVTFNQAADSLNVWQTGTAIAGDLSRQFQTETTTPNVVASSAISGWAIAGLAAIAVIIAMAIGYYENDRDDRKRRKSSRKSRRRHRGAS